MSFARALLRRFGVVLLVSAIVAGAGVPRAHARPDATYRRVTDWLLLLAGGAVGLVAHESGHLAVDFALRARPVFTPVHLGPLPFFAIEPRDIRDDRELYLIAMSGFLSEAISTELIFARRPDLRHHHRPFLEGMLAFHAVLDVSYAITGFAGVGPPQSDVNSLARASGVPRWAIATMLVVPVGFDVLRYVRPDTRHWSTWVGLGSRLPLFGLVFKF